MQDDTKMSGILWYFSFEYKIYVGKYYFGLICIVILVHVSDNYYNINIIFIVEDIALLF